MSSSNVPTATATATSTAAEPVRIAVVSASVRADDRTAAHVLPWLQAALGSVPGIAVDVIDLADTAVPANSILRPGGSGGGPLADRVAAADGYVVLTPEYNHSYPAPLKQFIDAHYAEWGYKAATVVSYGVLGGLLATEHLRGVFAELHVVVTRRVVGLAAPWDAVTPDGVYTPAPGLDRALRGAIDELIWWADLLHEARATREVPA